MREHRDRIGNRVHGVGSDVLERGAEGAQSRRIWFLMRDVELKDTSVLLWVLALLLLGWAVAFLLLLLL